MNRWIAPLIALAILATAAPLHADPTTDGNRRLYDNARRCFVVNANFVRAFEQAGDSANAALFEDKAHTAYDLAYAWAKELGLSQAQVSADIDATRDAELPRLMRDQAYLTASAKFCKEQGLM